MNAKRDDQDDMENHGAGHSLPSPGPFSRLRAYFLTGVLVTAPLAITFGLAWWFIEFVDSKVMPLLPAQYNPMQYLPVEYQDYGIPGFGLVVVLVVITLVGWFTTNFAGRALIKLYERILGRIPAVRSIYGAIKQILETVLPISRMPFVRRFCLNIRVAGCGRSASSPAKPRVRFKT